MTGRIFHQKPKIKNPCYTCLKNEAEQDDNECWECIDKHTQKMKQIRENKLLFKNQYKIGKNYIRKPNKNKGSKRPSST